LFFKQPVPFLYEYVEDTLLLTTAQAALMPLLSPFSLQFDKKTIFKPQTAICLIQANCFITPFQKDLLILHN